MLSFAARQAAAQQASSAHAPHRVVFVLTSGDDADWEMTLANVRNMIKGFAPAKVEVEVIAYGPGLAFLKKGSSVETQVTALESPDVHLLACENSMRMQHVTAADLSTGVGTVPSGVVELVTRQEQGWSYIKAGR
jgi:intracellular sulfur oxidation DsrE/DsrF family protein